MGDDQQPEATSTTRRPLRYGKRAVLLLVAGASLYLLLPSLLAVFGSWRSLEHLDWPFAVLVLVAEVASYVWLWQLDRIALHTKAWFSVATAQLSGNLAGRIFPGGGATAAATSASMLHDAGVETGDAAAAFGASTALQLATTAALPLLALPAILGGAPVNHSLAAAAYLGAGLFVLLLIGGAAVMTTDRPLELAGNAIEWFLNHTIRRKSRVSGVAHELLDARDFIRSTLGARWKGAMLAAAGNTVFDYLALLAALRAVGAEPQPSLVLLAYVSAELLALLPLTPGGLGFVEAGLVGTLTLAGVTAHDALAATLLYRIASYWLPLPAGAVAYVLFRRRYGAVGS
ncbi:MAG: lysylphosphatidylglycerol synthase transmembrane domain-containing protein [Gaiellaceae bacterium]